MGDICTKCKADTEFWPGMWKDIWLPLCDKCISTYLKSDIYIKLTSTLYSYNTDQKRELRVKLWNMWCKGEMP